MGNQSNPGNRFAETRFDRGAWLTLAVVLAWLVVIVATAIASMTYLSDGWAHIRGGPDGSYRANAPITYLPTTLQLNDVIIAINGQSLTPDNIPLLPADLVEGQTLTYTVRRLTPIAGAPVTTTLEIPVTLMRVGPSGYFYSMAWRLRNTPSDFLVATVGFLTTAFTFFMRPGNLGARYMFLIFGFYFVITVFGFSESALFEFTYHPLLTFLQQLGPSSWFWYFFPSIALMALSFPVIKAPLRRFPRLLPVLAYGVPGSFAFSAYALVVITRDYDSTRFAEPIFVVAIVLAVGTIFASIVHNWLTIREPAARAQLRWLALGLSLGLGVPLGILIILLAINGQVGREMDGLAWLFMLFPLALVVAITRYRLFDIDLIIRRTLQYSLLSGLLALVYFGGIVVLQGIFTALMGQNDNTLITVISTLIIAALFLPLRRRVQDFIDKRFFRQKYDAQKVLAEFAATARDETDLDTLTTRLVEVVQETMQPENVTLWLKATEDDRRWTMDNATVPRLRSIRPGAINDE